MSIVALKKKAHAMYDSHSRGSDGFSLNGKVRFTSGVGSNLGKSVTRTPFHGVEPKGYGGGGRCRVGGIEARVCGREYVKFVANSGTCHTPQFSVKPSAINTTGMIQKRFTGILHGKYPHTWVQPPQDSSKTHVERLSAATVACETDSNGVGSIEATKGCGPYSKRVGPETTEERMFRITSGCINPICSKVPFPIPFTSSSGCKSFYATWQEAQKAGLLCATFKG